MYDAILLVSFGGPEKTDDVLPFLENVLRGKPVPRGRLLEVAEHYYHFGGKSPINDQNRELIAALRSELDTHGIHLPIYWGNRNWHPMLTGTLGEMKRDGIKHALAFFTSAYSSYSGCRQYRENIATAQQLVGEGAPKVDKIRAFYNHPGYIETVASHAAEALANLPVDRRSSASLLFTAHSIPMTMASTSRYVEQLEEASRLLAQSLGHPACRLVYQSRSGSPSQPWLGPDILDVIDEEHSSGAKDIVVVPIGFVSDHMEIIFDLDTQARERCQKLGLTYQRGHTAGTHPRFVSMIRELIVERICDTAERPTAGLYGACPDFCAVDCCPAPAMLARITGAHRIDF
ncbi:MAG TPA: ferrochelatase [Candidatus Saccharimonadales bacterium]|nr:ferrochelatase [Candidatus Saccharimonadales bacterium]